MNYSAPKTLNDYPLIVCTNTWRDYAITVRRGRINDSIADRILKNVIPGFARVINQKVYGIQTAVGVMRIDDQPDVILAFRVFDVGIFRGRPNTIGFVGIIVPRHPWRKWPLSAALSLLPPPVPDSDHYNLSELQLDKAETDLAEPFASLDRWELAHELPPADRPICYCQPADACPTITWSQTKSIMPSKVRSKRIYFRFVIISCLLIGITGTVYWWHIYYSNNLQPSSPYPLHLDDGRKRDRLVQALLIGNFVNDFEANRASYQELQIDVIAAAEIAQKNLAKLQESVTPMEKTNTPADIAAVVHNHIRNWEKPPALEKEIYSNNVEEQTEKALNILDQYNKIYDKAKDITYSPDTISIGHLIKNLEKTIEFPFVTQNTAFHNACSNFIKRKKSGSNRT